MGKGLVAAVVMVLVVAGCGGDDGTSDETGDGEPAPSASGTDTPAPEETESSEPAGATVEIEGDASAEVNQLAIAAIADLRGYWAEEFPALYGEDYQEVAGGLYAITTESESGPACADSYSDVQGNAFYCRLDDSVAWDAEELLPDLQEKYGSFVIPVVLAHEWGHAMQQRSGFFDQNELTVSSELQADCFAGSWAAHAQETGAFEVTAADLDLALAGILDLRDTPGTNSMDPSAHGSGFDRVSAFQDGFDGGATVCGDFADGTPVVLELPFTSQEDADSGGNAPYESIINGVPFDLEDYWSQLYPELTGEEWVPLSGFEPFDPADPPACGDADTSGFSLFYCVPEDYVGLRQRQRDAAHLRAGRRLRRRDAAGDPVGARRAGPRRGRPRREGVDPRHRLLRRWLHRERHPPQPRRDQLVQHLPRRPRRGHQGAAGVPRGRRRRPPGRGLRPGQGVPAGRHQRLGVLRRVTDRPNAGRGAAPEGRGGGLETG